MTCLRESLHEKYISYTEFINEEEKYKTKLRKCFIPNSNSDEENISLTPRDNLELHKFLVNMSSLTGLLLISSEGVVKWPGTGFIVKLRRNRNSQCPCPLQHNNTKTEHAIVSISTAYHMFNEDANNQVKRFDEINEIWGKCQTEFKLDYNNDDETRQKLKENKSLPTLYGHRLVEMDKDLDYDCDWCAIECVTHEIKLIETLETIISNYQEGLAELYKKSQTDMYKDVNLVVIIGHPHNWAKKISIGQSRHREILKEVRSKQTWCRYSYDNPACAGSSGSPIFIWGQPITGFGYWFGHPHNHSERFGEIDRENRIILHLGKSTIGVENIY